MDEYELDHAGNPTCGQSFMAGTICSDHPEHDGGHNCLCQCCGGDWYEGSCSCVQSEDGHWSCQPPEPPEYVLRGYTTAGSYGLSPHPTGLFKTPVFIIKEPDE